MITLLKVEQKRTGQSDSDISCLLVIKRIVLFLNFLLTMPLCSKFSGKVSLKMQNPEISIKKP